MTDKNWLMSNETETHEKKKSIVSPKKHDRHSRVGISSHLKNKNTTLGFGSRGKSLDIFSGGFFSWFGWGNNYVDRSGQEFLFLGLFATLVSLPLPHRITQSIKINQSPNSI